MVFFQGITIWGVVMVRFILVSFGFMAWAFYEMSGGAAFDPEEVRTARLEAAEAEQEAKAAKIAAAKAVKPQVVAQQVIAPASKVVVDTSPVLNAMVTRASVNLTNLSNTLSQNVQGADSDTVAIIPSLIDPTDGQSTEETAQVTNVSVSESEDIRTVSGNRVNVRGGPGTDFGIVTKLGRGDAVKVLEDRGDGWVRLEPLNGGPSGWMADFLLTQG